MRFQNLGQIECQDRLSELMSDRLSVYELKRMSDRMANIVSELMSDRMSESLPERM